MTRISKLLLAGVTGIALLAAGCPGDGETDSGEAGARPPVILLITVDGLSPESLSLFGGPTQTPHLEALAAGGAAWSDAWTASPMSRPAVATYLTGLAPDRHGVRDNLFVPLPEDLPTLATQLREEGYRTAAFPGSSFLGYSSGLLRGFDLVDEPDSPPVSPARWLPVCKVFEYTAESFEAWLNEIPRGERYFGWVHFPQPLLTRLVDEVKSYPNVADLAERGLPPRAERPGGPAELPTTIEDLDATLGRIAAALAERGEAESALIVLAGTSGDPTGGEDEPPGEGLSVHERALRVPLLIDLPDSLAGARLRPDAPWAPDVAATIAGLGGIVLGMEIEGVSLVEPVATDRIRIAWSWAPRDQMGWSPLRAAASAGVMRVEGYETRLLAPDGGPEPDGATAERLAGALASRLEPPPLRVDVESVRAFLESHEVVIQPVPPGGREVEAERTRRTTAALILNGRVRVSKGLVNPALASFSKAMHADPGNLSALLDRGQMLSLVGRRGSLRAMRRAAGLYPSDPEILHWLAHAVWTESWEEAEGLLLVIAPHKQHEGDLLYDLACTRSLAGDAEASADYLRRAIEAGFRNWDHFERDPDLRNLRETPLFSSVIREYRQQ